MFGPRGISHRTRVGAKITDWFRLPSFAQQKQLPNEFCARIAQHILEIVRRFVGTSRIGPKFSLQNASHHRPGFHFDQFGETFFVFRFRTRAQKRSQQRIVSRCRGAGDTVVRQGSSH